MYNPIEYSSMHSETTGSLWFYSNDEATNFNNNIENIDNFKSFEYKSNFLLADTVAQPNPNNDNGVLKNAITTVPYKHLSNFCRSLKMPLVNCKVQLNVKWTDYCVLPAAGNDNTNANHNIIFTSKGENLYVPFVTFQQKTIKSHQNFLAKDLKDKFIGMNIKQWEQKYKKWG